jgi:NADH-quinone oxidoreductase subunit G
MDRYAAISIRYQPGADAQAVYGVLVSISHQPSATPALHEAQRGASVSDQAAKFASSDAAINDAGKLIAEAQNLIVIFGDERQASDAALAQACANLVVATGHIGRANNGLLPLWPHNNTQGVYDMLSAQGVAWPAGGEVKALYIIGSDPSGDGQSLPKSDFLVVQELFLTQTAQQADVVLPALAWAERDGTFTNAERRVQRYYKALPPTGQAKADWDIFRSVAEKLGLKWMFFGAESVMNDIAARVPAYAGLDYARLAETKEEWPPVGTSSDLYFGGTAYDNRGGVGAQTKSLFEIDGRSELKWIEPAQPTDQLLNVRQLNRHGTLIDQSSVYEVRLREAELVTAEA